MPSRLQATINEYKQQLLAHERTAEASLDYAHKQTLALIEPQLNALYDKMSAALNNGENISTSWLYEQNRLQAIEQYITGAIDHFGALTQMQVESLQHQGVRLGTQAGQALLQAVTPAGVNFSFGMPSPQAIAGMVGATQKGSPLADLFRGFGAEAAQKAKTALISGVTLGYNPRQIAPSVQDALNVSRYRALTIARTEMIRSYRDANVATFQANSDVVDQWRWSCALSARTCAACLAMDGTLHDLDETLDSHPCCRCTPIPVTKSWDDILGNAGIDATGIEDTNPALDMQTGEEWFAQQDESVQRQVLGNAKYEAFADGKFTLQDVVGTSHDKDWGASIHERSLKETLKAAGSTPKPIIKASKDTWPDSIQAQGAYLQKAQADAYAALTEDEKYSIGDYTGSDYRLINASLRNPSSLDEEDRQLIDIDASIANLDKAISRAITPTDMTVYRGIEAYGGTLDFFQENIGNVINDKAYGSTTLDYGRADMFADIGAVIQIKIPKGYNGLYVSPFSQFEENYGTPEYEFLLPRDTKYKIVEYIPETDSAKAQFIFEVVP